MLSANSHQKGEETGEYEIGFSIIHASLDMGSFSYGSCPMDLLVAFMILISMKIQGLCSLKDDDDNLCLGEERWLW